MYGHMVASGLLADDNAAVHLPAARSTGPAMDIITIDTPGLGDRSHVAVHDGVAVVVDPQRDIDRVLAVCNDHGARISHVLETHVHNDYVTGGLALARRTDAEYVLNAADDVGFERRGVTDGDMLAAGGMQVTAIATPGHTFTHLAYRIEVAGQPGVLCSGGSLLFGSTGRTDLLGAAHAATLAGHQWDSVRRLVDELPPDTTLLPTHGFGSFCAATPTSGADESTIGIEAAGHPAMSQDRASFVEQLLAGLDDHPGYYAHMAPRNAAGPAAVDLSEPRRADPAELRRRIDAGEWVVDLRHRTAFADGHVPGTFNFGLETSFVTWLGWLIPWGTPVTLLGATAQDVAHAQRELVRIGIDRPAAAALGGPDDWSTGPVARHTTATFGDLARVLATDEAVQVVDVRRDGERDLAHIPGSLHIPLHEVADRTDELPDDRPAWIHCAGGYRASIAVALVAAAGHDVVAIDDAFDTAVELGLTQHGPPSRHRLDVELATGTT